MLLLPTRVLGCFGLPWGSLATTPRPLTSHLIPFSPIPSRSVRAHSTHSFNHSTRFIHSLVPCLPIISSAAALRGTSTPRGADRSGHPLDCYNGCSRLRSVASCAVALRVRQSLNRRSDVPRWCGVGYYSRNTRHGACATLSFDVHDRNRKLAGIQRT